jgi:hypothetical protein
MKSNKPLIFISLILMFNLSCKKEDSNSSSSSSVSIMGNWMASSEVVDWQITGTETYISGTDNTGNETFGSNEISESGSDNIDPTTIDEYRLNFSLDSVTLSNLDSSLLITVGYVKSDSSITLLTNGFDPYVVKIESLNSNQLVLSIEEELCCEANCDDDCRGYDDYSDQSDQTSGYYSGTEKTTTTYNR